MLTSIKKAIKFYFEYRYLKMKYSKIKIGKGFQIRGAKYIKCDGNMVIGEKSKILIWDCYQSGKKTQDLTPILKIGSNFRATRELVIQCAGTTSIGNNVLIASNVFIIDYNHGMNPESDNYLDNNLIVKGVTIDDGVWIGNNAIILPGAKIGKKAIIGAGSVVSKEIPEFSIAVGNPARIIKKWDSNSNKWESVKNECY